MANKGEVMRKNWLMTAAGIIGLFSGLPTVWGTAVKEGAISASMPGWLYVACMFCLPLSLGIVGIAGKGQDEHSNINQVQAASTDKIGNPIQPVAGPVPEAPKP